MKIILSEPLNIKKEKLDELSRALKEMGHSFKSYETKAKSVEELKERVKESEILIIGNSELPEEVIKSCNNLKMLSIAFTGVDHVHIESLREKEVTVCNSRGYSNVAVSELVLGLTLELLRNIKKGDEATRNESNLKPYIGSELRNKKVGIVGLGEIGLMTAKLFQGFGCEVVGYSRNETKAFKENNIKYMELEQLFKECDIVSLHIPYNASTNKMIDDSKLKLMKEGSIIINTARGGVLDNKELSKYLKSGKLLAGIDVYETEPPLKKDYVLVSSKNCILTPHVAYETKESMIKRSDIVFKNVYEYLRGNVVNEIK